jgi:hypothetical protein
MFLGTKYPNRHDLILAYPPPVKYCMIWTSIQSAALVHQPIPPTLLADMQRINHGRLSAVHKTQLLPAKEIRTDGWIDQLDKQSMGGWTGELDRIGNSASIAHRVAGDMYPSIHHHRSRSQSGMQSPLGFFLPTGRVKLPGSGSGLPVWFAGNRTVTGRVWIWIQTRLRFGRRPVYRAVCSGYHSVWAVTATNRLEFSFFFAWIKRIFGTSFAHINVKRPHNVVINSISH